MTAACLAVSGVATAEPCQVTIARVPAELRATIDDALSAEPHCRVALELRIVATEGGYYMLARDLHGRTRERIVPDAASAATLVASWAADDEIDATDDRAPVRVAAVPPAGAPEPVVAASTALEPRSSGPFITLYGVIGPYGGGLRADLDVLHRGRWALGVSAARTTGDTSPTFTDDFGNSDIFARLETTEYDLLAYVAYERDLSDAWHVRASLGGGVAIVDATFPDPNDGFPVATIPYPTAPPAGTGGLATAPIGEAALAIDADIGYGVSLVAGVRFDAYFEPTTLTYPISSDDDGHVSFDPTWSWSLLGGLRYEL